ncbi:ABC transporter permease subunit [Brevibacillus sp. NRS-1366]|uniref:branched-chain amino acid ABC transporter ATP-binding protein/permease n=1 Tax=Brevibacillus sp. NRS-1366 TaxID=3233899 RepID=UPI003D1CAD75
MKILSLFKNKLIRDLAIIICLLVILPMISTSYFSSLLGKAIIFAILAISIDIAWGYGGILSLGHSVFFGLGAYAFAIMSLQGGSLFASLGGVALGILLPVLLAFLVSWFVFYSKSSPFYIGVVTLSLSILFEQLSIRLSSLTGGQNGLTNIPSFPFSGSMLYYFLLSLLVLTVMVAYQFVKSDMGKLVVAVRDNEERCKFLGYNTQWIRTLVFVFSGAIAGFAGVLYAPFDGFVSPSLLNFTLATEIIVWVAIGGRGKLVGAVIGALLINILSPIFNDISPYLWQIFLGFIFVLAVVFVPNGLYSFTGKAKDKTTPYKIVTKAKDPVVKQDKGNDVLVIRGVKVAYGDLTILDGLNLALRSGELQCVVGPNGAGKSTLINAITGRVKYTEGSITLEKEQICAWSPQKIARSRVARTFQSTNIIASLTVEENLQLASRKGATPSFYKNGKTINLSSSTVRLLHETKLHEKLTVIAGNLSHGDQQALELCMVLALEPKVLLLDEPTAGLTLAERKKIGEIFKSLGRDEGLSLMIIEHDIDFVKEIADRVTLLHSGKIAMDGSVTEITSSNLVKEIYLGGRVG